MARLQVQYENCPPTFFVIPDEEAEKIFGKVDTDFRRYLVEYYPAATVFDSATGKVTLSFKGLLFIGVNSGEEATLDLIAAEGVKDELVRIKIGQRVTQAVEAINAAAQAPPTRQ